VPEQFLVVEILIGLKFLPFFFFNDLEGKLELKERKQGKIREERR
jgi:hypothetical protein